jgi:hypothetical protein
VPAPARADELAADRLDHFAAVAAVASAVHVEGTWDGGFGGELGVGRLSDRRGLALWAASVGLLGFSERTGGRAWAELAVGTRWPTGVPVGIGLGPAVELDDIRRPRWGGQATLFVFAAVVPYVRVGAVDDGGLFADVGVRIAFPVIRW